MGLDLLADSVEALDCKLAPGGRGFKPQAGTRRVFIKRYRPIGRYRSRDKHHRDSGFCGRSRGSLRDITRETAGYPAGVCGISRGRLRDIPRYSFGRPVVSRVPRSEKTWCETPKSAAARNGDGGVSNVYFYVLPGDLCRADGV
ncbi:hypothetical protein Bbelb_009250 [Branchiostoma belcheri]|nr:hypothetical protein Bbelb_009250 [Branchiostoma belcheri]